MHSKWPAATPRPKLTPAFVQRLATSSLILFLLGAVAQRTWVLLNSDVAQLIRRLH